MDANDIRVRKEIVGIDKEILKLAKEIKAAGADANNSQIERLKKLKDEKKLKEDILNTEEDMLGLKDKESSLAYDITAAEKKKVKLKIQQEKLDQSSIKKGSAEYKQLKERLAVSRATVEANINMARTVQGQQIMYDKILGAMGTSKGVLVGMVATAKALTAAMLANPFLAIGALLAVAVGLMVKFFFYVQNLTKELGVTSVQAERLALGMKAAELEGKILGYDAIQTAKALGQEFGTMSAMTAENVRELGRLQASLGISTDTSAKLAKTFDAFNKTGISGAIDQMKKFSAMAISNGVIVGDVMNDIASNTEVFADFARDGGENIARAAIQAKKLGLSIATTAKMANSLLDFESSIEKEMEASLMIGRQINFNKARQLSLEGDLAGAAKSVIDQVGGIEAFRDMNVLQRRSVAQAAGLDTSELMKFMSGREDMEVKNPTVDAMNQVNQSIGITNSLLKTIVPMIDYILMLMDTAQKWLKDNWVYIKESSISLKILKMVGTGVEFLGSAVRGLVKFMKLIFGKFSKLPIIGKLFGGAQVATAATVTKQVGKKKVGEKVTGVVAENMVKAGTAAATATKAVGSPAAKVGGEVAERAFKKIPGIGALISFGMAFKRYKEGDIGGAALEAISGALTTIPGYGTAGSLAIDGYLLSKDIKKVQEENDMQKIKLSEEQSQNQKDIKEQNLNIIDNQKETINAINKNTEATKRVGKDTAGAVLD